MLWTALCRNRASCDDLCTFLFIWTYSSPWHPLLLFENQIAEISRVLKPGGVFVATTFLSTPTNSGPLSIDALRPLRQVKEVAERWCYYLFSAWPDAPSLLCAADCWASEQQLQLLHWRRAGRPVQILWPGQLQQQGAEVIHHVLRAKAIAEYHIQTFSV